MSKFKDQIFSEMTDDRIATVVEKLKKIVDTNYSNYAGFRLSLPPEAEFYNCVIVNNEPHHSSNLTIRLDEFDDALKIIHKITGQEKEKILEELNYNGSFYKENEPLFLHYLKLTQKCEE